MTLHYEEFGGGMPLVLVHGLFGSGTNWRGVARKLAQNFHVISMDLPNHGRSRHTASMSYGDMSEALYETAQCFQHGTMNWVGHSMGGKAVMELALTHPEVVTGLVVVDIAPVRYAHSQADLVDAMMKLDLDSVKSRGDADRLLSAVITDTPTRLFLLQNLLPVKGGYKWRLNLPLLNEYMNDIQGFPDHAGVSYQGPTLMMGGENSDYMQAAYHDIVLGYFPAARFETIAAAGHWVHADQPQAVCESITGFVNSRS
jgi:esterase